jgi:putative tricarboxylic transport membrane protein
MRDQTSGLFWLAISIIACVKSFQANLGTFHLPGPGFFPFWSGGILGALSIILVVTSTLKKNESQGILNLWRRVEWGRVIKVLISLFIYAIFLPSLGYLVATSGLMIVLLGIVRRTNLWIRVASAVIISLVTYVVFYKWLAVHLPRGIFGF